MNALPLERGAGLSVSLENLLKTPKTSKNSAKERKKWITRILIPQATPLQAWILPPDTRPLN
jgi:hypothetical protein